MTAKGGVSETVIFRKGRTMRYGDAPYSTGQKSGRKPSGSLLGNSQVIVSRFSEESYR